MFTIWSKLISFASVGSAAHAGNPTIAASGIITSTSKHNFSNNLPLTYSILSPGDYQLSAANVGYTGAFPTGVNTPRFFSGKLYFTVAGCASAPTPGNTLSSVTAVCPNINFNLSLQNTTSGSGVTYQWQKASAAAGPYTNIAGATNATYSAIQTAATYYRCNVTCGTNRRNVAD